MSNRKIRKVKERYGKCSSKSLGLHFPSLSLSLWKVALAWILCCLPNPSRAKTMCFGELQKDPNRFLDLPSGYSYKVLMAAEDPMTDGKPFPYRPDLNVFLPLAGPRAFLLISHELAMDEKPQWGTGAITRLYLVEGSVAESRLLADGMRTNCSGTLTPWGTVLTAEEYPRDPVEKYPEEGYIWEIDPITGKKSKREALGRFSHESAAVAQDGSIYLSEDKKNGFLYRFIPDKKWDLSHGKLFAFLRDTREWKALADPLHAPRNAQELGATPFQRLEDLEIDPKGKFLYIAETGSEPKDLYGRILKLDLKTLQMSVFLEGNGEQLANPDNLVFDLQGRLWIVEDQFSTHRNRYGGNRIWVVDDKARSCLFARLQESCEPTGPIFDVQAKNLFVNFQCDKTKDRVLRIQGF